MAADRDGDDEREEVSPTSPASPPGSAPVRAEPPASLRRRLLRGLWRQAGRLPELPTVLRRVALDLVALVLMVVVVSYFVSALNRETIVLEAPSVPQALQDQGITPTLLTRLIQAKVQGIYAAALAAEAAAPEPGERALPEAVSTELIQAQIDQIFRSHGVQVPSDASGGQRLRAGSEIAAVVVQATNESIDLVSDQIGVALDSTRIVEVTPPPSSPLVVAASGLSLSIDSLAANVRELLGIRAQRRMTVSVVCHRQGCGDEVMSLYMVAMTGDAVLTDSVPLREGDIDGAIAAATDYAMRRYDPQALAVYYYRNGELESAERVARLMLEDQPADPQWVQNLIGAIALRRDDLATAGRYFSAAVESEPAFFEAHLNLGVVRFREGQFEDAREAFNAALAIDPRQAVAQVNLGNTLLRLCDWEAASRAYEQALAIDPYSASAQTSLSLVDSIPQLKTYLIDETGQRKVVSMIDSQVARRKPAWRTLEEVAAAATFCEALSKKPF